MTQSKNPKEILTRGRIVLNLAEQEVIVNGTPHHVTAKERALLSVFMQRPGQVLTRAFLMREVWDTDYWEDTRTLEVHVSMLRKKIEQDPSNPRLIQTVRGVGYVFVGEA